MNEENLVRGQANDWTQRRDARGDRGWMLELMKF